MVGIKQYATLSITRGATNGLHQRGLGAQKAFFIGIENGDQRTFRNIQAFAQQIDTDQNIKRAETQIADDFNALQRINIGMHIAHTQTLLMHIFGQIFGHFLGQRGHQNALAFLGQFMAFGDEIIDLSGGRTNFASRVNQAGRANDLLNENAARALHFPRAGSGRYMHGLGPHNIPFLKFHRPIINARWQAEAKLGQCRFAAEVTAKHAADLRNGDMAFIGKDQRIIGQIFK